MARAWMDDGPNPRIKGSRTNAWRLVRARANRRAEGGGFLHQIMTEEILDRLSLVKREFRDCLVIGICSDQLASRLADLNMRVFRADSAAIGQSQPPAVQCDEDRLPFADHSFDLIINVGTLDTVNDMPGALILTRRILRPDGFFLSAFCGAESLPHLKSLIMAAEEDRVAPHIHPQIDVRTAGDLLARAGLALPVADSDTLHLRYSDLSRLLCDVRDAGGSNILKHSIQPIGRQAFNRVQAAFDAAKDGDGKFTERFEILSLCGWAPHPDQPQPAKRGSGQASLSSILQKKEPGS